MHWAVEKDIYKRACIYKDKVLICMNKFRSNADTLEMIVDKDVWPLPSYGDLLFEMESI